MKVKVIHNGDNNTITLREGTTVGGVLKSLKVNAQENVAAVNGTVAHPSRKLREGDELEVIRIVFGG